MRNALRTSMIDLGRRAEPRGGRRDQRHGRAARTRRRKRARDPRGDGDVARRWPAGLRAARRRGFHAAAGALGPPECLGRRHGAGSIRRSPTGRRWRPTSAGSRPKRATRTRQRCRARRSFGRWLLRGRATSGHSGPFRSATPHCTSVRGAATRTTRSITPSASSVSEARRHDRVRRNACRDPCSRRVERRGRGRAGPRSLRGRRRGSAGAQR